MFVFELSYLLSFSLLCEEMRAKAYPAESEPSENSGVVHAILMSGYSKMGGFWNDLSAHDKEYIYIKTTAQKNFYK